MISVMDSIPVVDFSNPDREANSKELVRAMETVGFVYLDNVPGYNSSVEKKLPHQSGSEPSSRAVWDGRRLAS